MDFDSIEGMVREQRVPDLIRRLKREIQKGTFRLGQPSRLVRWREKGKWWSDYDSLGTEPVEKVQEKLLSLKGYLLSSILLSERDAGTIGPLTEMKILDIYLLTKNRFCFAVYEKWQGDIDYRDGTAWQKEGERMELKDMLTVSLDCTKSEEVESLRAFLERACDPLKAN